MGIKLEELKISDLSTAELKELLAALASAVKGIEFDDDDDDEASPADPTTMFEAVSLTREFAKRLVEKSPNAPTSFDEIDSIARCAVGEAQADLVISARALRAFCNDPESEEAFDKEGFFKLVAKHLSTISCLWFTSVSYFEAYKILRHRKGFNACTDEKVMLINQLLMGEKTARDCFQTPIFNGVSFEEVALEVARSFLNGFQGDNTRWSPEGILLKPANHVAPDYEGMLDKTWLTLTLEGFFATKDASMEQGFSTHKGYQYFTRTVNMTSFKTTPVNGYVIIPKEHVLYEQPMSYAKQKGNRLNELAVHGGITFAERWDMEGHLAHGEWVIGFDTSHLNDGAHQQNEEYVVKQTIKLIDQLVTMT